MTGEERLLLSFCQVHRKSLVCYGAGLWAEVLTYYLRIYDIEFMYYCVTDDSNIINDVYLGKKVVALSNVQFDNDTAVILGLNETWQQEIEERTEIMGIKYVFKMSLQLFKILNQAPELIEHWTLKNLPYNLRAFGEGVKEVFDTYLYDIYEKRWQELVKEYPLGVELRRIEGSNIAMLIFAYICAIEYIPRTTGKDIVYFPAQLASKSCRRPVYVNNYIIANFKGDDFDVVVGETEDFWRYCLEEHTECFSYSGKADYWTKLLPIASEHMRNHDFFAHSKCYMLMPAYYGEKGRQLLLRMGIKKKFVSIYSRDGTYYDQRGATSEKTLIMDKYRNSRLENFSIAIRWLHEHDISTIRVGSTPRKDNFCAEHDVIDYAGKFHEDYMDFYLAMHNEFYIGNTSGVEMFQALSSKPRAMVNVWCMVFFNDTPGYTSQDRDLIIYCKFYSNHHKRLLSLSEILALNHRLYLKYGEELSPRYSGSIRIAEMYRDEGIELIDNTPLEILALTKEMTERLNGNTFYTAEDEELQKKFWTLMKVYIEGHPRCFWYNARVGREFLKENEWMTR